MHAHVRAALTGTYFRHAVYSGKWPTKWSTFHVKQSAALREQLSPAAFEAFDGRGEHYRRPEAAPPGGITTTSDG